MKATAKLMVRPILRCGKAPKMMPIKLPKQSDPQGPSQQWNEPRDEQHRAQHADKNREGLHDDWTVMQTL